MTELRDYAGRVLLGPSLDDKLFAPSKLTDRRGREPSSLPELPARMPGHQFSDGGGDSLRSGVDERDGRVKLLHAFANHELLAIELMALGLLRFTEAPAAFRRGLAQTLAEEQRHFGLYLQRMRALGLEFGERPCSGYFWDVMAPLERPEDFVVHMALTFEQANLDFAAHYQQAFRAAGDSETAAVLQTVLDDEIGHVAFGVRWFERWRTPGPSLFEAHADALRPPLQIVRARGLGFAAQPRRDAGLSSEYIDAIRVAGGSRGRAPTVRWFNGAVEHEVRHGLRYTAPASTRRYLRDLETLPMFRGVASDVVLVSQEPRVAFLASLARAGFDIPRFESADLHRSPWPAPRTLGPLGALEPWGQSPRTAAFGRTAQCRTRDPERGPAPWSPSFAQLHDKRTAAAMLETLLREHDEPSWCRPDTVGVGVEAEADLETVVHAFAPRHDAVLIKACFSAAGRGHWRVPLPWSPSDRAHALAMVRRGPVLVEPWFDVVLELSLRMRVDAQGARVSSIGRGLSSPRGGFEGAVLGPVDAGLPTALRRWLRGDGRDADRLGRMANRVAAVVGERARSVGYTGLAGVDALVVRGPDGFGLRPLVDLNPRCTMGHVAAALAPRVSRRSIGVWRAMSRQEVARWGWPDLATWAQAVAAEHPPRLDARGRIEAGVVHTTDPARAQDVVMTLAVAPSPRVALSVLRGRRSPAPKNRHSPPTRDR